MKSAMDGDNGLEGNVFDAVKASELKRPLDSGVEADAPGPEQVGLVGSAPSGARAWLLRALVDGVGWLLNRNAASRACYLAQLKRRLRGRCFKAELPGFLADMAGPLVPKPFEPNLSDEPDFFEICQERGFHVTPNHFYSPIPDTRVLPNELWHRPEGPCQMPGVDMNDDGQLELVREVFPRFRDEYERIPIQPGKEPLRFYLNNGGFEGQDALVLWCMVRTFRPRLILEIGSGFSSLLCAEAAVKNGSTRLVCVDPYANKRLNGNIPGLDRVVRKRVQDLVPDFFLQLTDGDFLFIDSSHVMKAGSDVNFLFFEVLPKLEPGVIVHFHDIYLPFEVPRRWIMEDKVFWNEQYVLRAFLTHNERFEVLFANTYMCHNFRQDVEAAFPQSPWLGGGSFWIRHRRSGQHAHHDRRNKQ